MGNTLWPNGTTTQPHVSSAFGPRKAPVGGASTVHRGVDCTGYSLVRSIAPGRVVAVGTPSGWAGGGTQVWVQHDGFFSKSMHMKAGSAIVRVGDDIPEGRILGVMGMTGTASGVHHHLEVTLGKVHYSNTGQIDPVPFIQNRISPAGGGGSEIVMDKETFIAWMWEFFKYRSRDGGGADWKGGPTVFERLTGLVGSVATLTGLVNPDEPEGGKGWIPFRNALSRWLIFHSRIDGPEGKGATIHERLNQIEAAVREAPGNTVTVKIDASMLATALSDPKVTAAFAGPIAKAVNDDAARRMVQ
jgi:hypothetical protein